MFTRNESCCQFVWAWFLQTPAATLKFFSARTRNFSGNKGPCRVQHSNWPLTPVNTPYEYTDLRLISSLIHISEVLVNADDKNSVIHKYAPIFLEQKEQGGEFSCDRGKSVEKWLLERNTYTSTLPSIKRLVVIV